MTKMFYLQESRKIHYLCVLSLKMEATGLSGHLLINCLHAGGEFSRQQMFDIFVYFSQKAGLGNSCKQIHMKCSPCFMDGCGID